MNLETQLQIFINQPYFPEHNYNLALCYDEIGQNAAAYSYYLRTAEFSNDDNLVYDSLLRCGICLGNWGKNRRSERGMYLHAINLLPKRPEAYYLLSRYYESTADWVDAYSMACLGLAIVEDEPDNVFVNYPKSYGLIFQKAVSSWWTGRHVESLDLFNLLLDKYENIMWDNFKESVHNNLTLLNSGQFPNLPYTSLVYFKLKYKFSGSSKIKRNNSQSYQDMFVLSMLDGKRKGKYLEIGSSDPFSGNNTALLETDFDWIGVSIDISEEEVNKFKKVRRNPVYLADAIKVDYAKLLEDNRLGTVIDFLQLDCDPPSVTYDILTKIPFDTHKFAVITYEHDYYYDETKSYKDKSRKFLRSKGYELVASNIAPNDTDDYEDWWIHPGLVRRNIINIFKNDTSSVKNAAKYMLN